MSHVRKLGSQTAGHVVVSSDHAIQNEVRRLKCKVITSEEFSQMMEQKMAPFVEAGQNWPELSENEIEDWIKQFNDRKE